MELTQWGPVGSPQLLLPPDSLQSQEAVEWALSQGCRNLHTSMTFFIIRKQPEGAGRRPLPHFPGPNGIPVANGKDHPPRTPAVWEPGKCGVRLSNLLNEGGRERAWRSRGAVSAILSNSSPSACAFITIQSPSKRGAPLFCLPMETGTTEDTRLPVLHCSHTSLLSVPTSAEFFPATGPLHTLLPLPE